MKDESAVSLTVAIDIDEVGLVGLIVGLDPLPPRKVVNHSVGHHEEKLKHPLLPLPHLHAVPHVVGQLSAPQQFLIVLDARVKPFHPLLDRNLYVLPDFRLDLIRNELYSHALPELSVSGLPLHRYRGRSPVVGQHHPQFLGHQLQAYPQARRRVGTVFVRNKLDALYEEISTTSLKVLLGCTKP